MTAAPPPEGPGYALFDGWLVQDVGRHTCGTGPHGHFGAHEPGCGLEPIGPIQEVVDAYLGRTAALVGLVDWLATSRAMQFHGGAECVKAMLSLGVDPIAVGFPAHPDTVRAWTTLAQDPPLQFTPTDLIRLVPLVGVRVLTEDPANAEDWALLGERLQGLIAANTWPKGHTVPATPIAWIERFLDAGRGPSYAQAMAARAAESGVRPDLLGFGPDVTPALFNDAVDAGLRNPVEVDLLHGCGFSTREAIRMLDRGRVAPGALAAAALTGLPRDRWGDLLPGLPADWFPARGPDHGVPTPPDPTSGMLAHGFTFEDLRLLVDRGWQELSPYSLKFGFGKHKGAFTKFSADQILQISTSETDPKRLTPWVQALLPGKREAAGGLPALAGARQDAASSITRLAAMGARPSHLNTYRRAGCRSIDDIAAARRAGITPARAEELLRLAGEQRYGKTRIGSLRLLLAAHQAHPVQGGTDE